MTVDPGRYVTEWDRGQAATTARLHRWTATITPHLGDGWYATVDQHDRTLLSNVDGRELYARDDRVHGRILIVGTYPESDYFRRGYGRRYDGITVSAARDPAAVAADVRRRLLPEYEQTLTALRAWVAQDDADRQARADLAARIQSAWPTAHPLYDSEGSRSTRTHLSLPGNSRHEASGHVEYGGDGQQVYRVSFRWLPAAVAVAIIDLVAASSRTDVLTEQPG
jgi:hypothetical protein